MQSPEPRMPSFLLSMLYTPALSSQTTYGEDQICTQGPSEARVSCCKPHLKTGMKQQGPEDAQHRSRNTWTTAHPVMVEVVGTRLQCIRMRRPMRCPRPGCDCPEAARQLLSGFLSTGTVYVCLHIHCLSECHGFSSRRSSSWKAPNAARHDWCCEALLSVPSGPAWLSPSGSMRLA